MMCWLTFSDPVERKKQKGKKTKPKKKTKNPALKPPMPGKVGQGSGSAHGYETDIDSQGQAMKTRAHTLPLATYFSLQSQGRHQPIDQPGAGNSPGQRGLCV